MSVFLTPEILQLDPSETGSRYAWVVIDPSVRPDRFGESDGFTSWRGANDPLLFSPTLMVNLSRRDTFIIEDAETHEHLVDLTGLHHPEAWWQAAHGMRRVVILIQDMAVFTHADMNGALLLPGGRAAMLRLGIYATMNGVGTMLA